MHIIYLKGMINVQNVPAIISTKDLAYLEDMFQWNFNACKKAHHYMNEINNEEIKNGVNNIYEMHKNICSEIINILR